MRTGREVTDAHLSPQAPVSAIFPACPLHGDNQHPGSATSDLGSGVNTQVLPATEQLPPALLYSHPAPQPVEGASVWISKDPAMLNLLRNLLAPLGLSFLILQMRTTI